MNKLNDLCNKLIATYRKDADDVPEGYYTLKQIAKGINKSLPTASRMIEKHLENGTVEVRMFRIDTNRGIYPVKHYRYVSSK